MVDFQVNRSQLIMTSILSILRGLFDKERIAKLKKGVLIVNNARGAIMDTQAVVDACSSGHIAGTTTSNTLNCLLSNLRRISRNKTSCIFFSPVKYFLNGDSRYLRVSRQIRGFIIGVRN